MRLCGRMASACLDNCLLHAFSTMHDGFGFWLGPPKFSLKAGKNLATLLTRHSVWGLRMGGLTSRQCQHFRASVNPVQGRHSKSGGCGGSPPPSLQVQATQLELKGHEKVSSLLNCCLPERLPSSPAAAPLSSHTQRHKARVHASNSALSAPPSQTEKPSERPYRVKCHHALRRFQDGESPCCTAADIVRLLQIPRMQSARFG